VNRHVVHEPGKALGDVAADTGLGKLVVRVAGGTAATPASFGSAWGSDAFW
jgi:hypothetical protein